MNIYIYIYILRERIYQVWAQEAYSLAVNLHPFWWEIKEGPFFDKWSICEKKELLIFPIYGNWRERNWAGLGKWVKERGRGQGRVYFTHVCLLCFSFWVKGFDCNLQSSPLNNNYFGKLYLKALIVRNWSSRFQYFSTLFQLPPND